MHKLPDMHHCRVSHGLTLIDPSEESSSGAPRRRYPYAVGGYNDRGENVDKNEILGWKVLGDGWSEFKNLTQCFVDQYSHYEILKSGGWKQEKGDIPSRHLVQIK